MSSCIVIVSRLFYDCLIKVDELLLVITGSFNGFVIIIYTCMIKSLFNNMLIFIFKNM